MKTSDAPASSVGPSFSPLVASKVMVRISSHENEAGKT